MALPARRVRHLVLWVCTALALAWLYRPLWHGRVLAARDFFRITIPDAWYLLESLKRHQLPLWTPYLRLGQPFLAALPSEVLYPPRVLSVLLAGPFWGPSLQHLAQVLIALYGTWRFTRRLGVSWAGSALAAASFAFSIWYTQLSDEFNIASGVCWAGLMAAAAVELRHRRRAQDVAWLAFFAVLSFLAGTPETLLWEGLVCLGVLAQGAQRVTQLALGVAALAWSFLLGAALGIPGLEMAAHSDRVGLSAQGALAWSTSWAQLINTVLPGAQEPSLGYFAEDQKLVLGAVFGAASGALALVGGAFSRRGRVLGGLAVSFGLLSLGKNFAPARWVLTAPLLASFRYPAKYLPAFFFCASVLAALGLDRVGAWARVRRRRGRDLLLLGAGLAAFAVGVVALGAALGARAGLKHGVAWFLLAVTVGALAVLTLPEDDRRGGRAQVALLAVCLLELFLGQALVGEIASADAGRLSAASALRPDLRLEGHDSRVHIENEDADVAMAATPQARPRLRVNDALDAARDDFKRNLAILDGAKLDESDSAPELERLERFLMTGHTASALVAVKTFVFEGEPVHTEDLHELTPPEHRPHVFDWDQGQPRAVVLHRARLAPDAEVLRALAGPLAPFKEELFLAEGEASTYPPCTGDQVEWRKDDPSELALDVHACGPGYLRLADTYFPGWEAWVDGKRVPIWRADYLMRGISLGAGTQHVRFLYRPRSWTIGLVVSALAWAAWAFVLLRARRQGSATALPA